MRAAEERSREDGSRAAGAIGGRSTPYVRSFPRLVSFVSNDDEPYRGRAASSSTQMRLFSSLRPSLALLGIQIDKANIVSHFEAVQRCSVGRLLPPLPREISGGSGEAAKLLYRGNKREKEAGRKPLLPLLRGCYRQLRRCSTRVGRAKERHIVHVHHHPLPSAESSEIVKACAGSQPPSCLRRPVAMEWMEYGVSQSKSGLLCSEKRSENCALHFPVLPSLFICRVRRVACEASTHGYTDSFF